MKQKSLPMYPVKIAWILCLILSLVKPTSQTPSSAADLFSVKAQILLQVLS